MASPAPLPRELDTAEPYRPPVAGLESAVAGDADAPRPAIAADTATGFDGACRLDDWGLIVAQGADAASFLHGQLTQDVSNLPQGRARLAGYCSAKGRLLASFVMWRDVSGASGSGGAAMVAGPTSNHRGVWPASGAPSGKRIADA